MRPRRAWFVRWLELFRKDRLEHEMDEELGLHLDLLTDEFVRRGLPLDQARTAARREIGGLEQTREAVRDQRGFRVLEAIGHDVRHAVRLLRQAPGFTVSAVTTLALGLGASIAIFSLVDGVLLQPLDYPDPDRLVAVSERRTGGPGGETGEPRPLAVAPANLADYRSRIGNALTLAAWTPTQLTFTGRGAPERLSGESVSTEYFTVAGLAPALGRPFVAADTLVGNDGVALISHDLWTSRYGSDPAAVGEPIELDGRRHEIVGVMPDRFVGLSQVAAGNADPVSVLVPLVVPPDMMSRRGEHVLRVTGRLTSDSTIAGVQRALDAVIAGLAQTDETAATLGVVVTSLQEEQVREVRPLLLLLLAGVAAVLLATCANVANLVVARSLARQREIAVRVALGASRARVLLALTIQGLVLALFGAAAGLGLAAWLIEVLRALAPAAMPRIDAVGLDARGVLFAAALAVGTAVPFSLLPAWKLRRARPQEALQATVRPVGGGWTPRTRSVLLFVEVGMSVLLLVTAGLMARSLQRLNTVDLGFDPSGVLAANIALPTTQYPTAESRFAFFDELSGRVEALPGVERATFANRLPLRGNWSSGFALEGATPDENAGRFAGFQAVSPDYFRTFRIPIVEGRSFEPADRDGAPAVAIVNAAFVREILNGATALGQRLRRHDEAPWAEIVGVAADLRRGGQAADIEPQVYLAAAQTSLYPLRLAELAVRAQPGTPDLADAIRSAVWSIDPNQPVTALRTMNETLAASQATRRFQTALFTLFAALALTLSLVGIYSVVSYVVAQRTAEIGLRLALGATAGGVVGWIVARSSRPMLLGTAAGLAAAWATSRYVSSLLFGITATDPATYLGGAGVLLIAGVSAALLAAWRATRVDPATVLK